MLGQSGVRSPGLQLMTRGSQSTKVQMERVGPHQAAAPRAPQPLYPEETWTGSCLKSLPQPL